MKKEMKSLVQSSIFLTMCSILVIFQIPFIGFLTLDLSYVSLLMCRRFVGMREAIIIAFIYPFFSLFSMFPDPIGLVFLLIQAQVVLQVDAFFNKKDFNIIGIVLTIVIVSFISYLLNLFIFTPWYYLSSEYFFWNQPSLIWVEFAYYFTYNVIKLSIIYVLVWPIYISLKKIIKN